MSRVVITEAIEGTITDVATVTGTASSWTTNDSTVNGDNLREEALDRRMIAARVITPAAGRGTHRRTTETNLRYTSWTLADTGGTPVRIGPITYDSTDGQMLQVRASFHFRSPQDGGAGTPDGASPGKTRIDFVLAYANMSPPGTPSGTIGGANWVAIDSTFRRSKLNDVTPAAVELGRNSGNYAVTHYFSVSMTSSNLWFGLFHKASGFDNGGSNQVRLSQGQLFTKVLTR